MSYIIYRPLYRTDIDRCSDLLFDSFMNDPYSWSACVGLPADVLYTWLHDMYLPQQINESVLSMIATIPNRESPIGICMAEDYDYPPPCNQPSSCEMDELVDACKEIVQDHLSANPPQKLAYLAFIAVDKEYRRKGIAEQLIDLCTRQLHALGYAVIAFCTSYRSRRLFEKQGYQTIGGISYQSFTMKNGSKPFESMPRDECSIVYLACPSA